MSVVLQDWLRATYPNQIWNESDFTRLAPVRVTVRTDPDEDWGSRRERIDAFRQFFSDLLPYVKDVFGSHWRSTELAVDDFFGLLIDTLEIRMGGYRPDVAETVWTWPYDEAERHATVFDVAMGSVMVTWTKLVFNNEETTIHLSALREEYMHLDLYCVGPRGDELRIISLQIGQPKTLPVEWKYGLPEKAFLRGGFLGTHRPRWVNVKFDTIRETGSVEDSCEIVLCATTPRPVDEPSGNDQWQAHIRVKWIPNPAMAVVAKYFYTEHSFDYSDMDSP